ncbi:MAG: hypothetical protein N2Z22_06365 [Turneriella sp.]|nr:hypothetical protein [Turneriella sp.]
MRTTIDLPPELYRRAKAEAALRGIKFRDLVLAGLTYELNRTEKVPDQPALRAEQFLASLEQLGGKIRKKGISPLRVLMAQRDANSGEAK